MFFFRRQDSPEIQLASSETQQEVKSRLASSALLPTDEIFDTQLKKWLPLYEWISSESNLPRVSQDKTQLGPKASPPNATSSLALGSGAPNASSNSGKSHAFNTMSLDWSIF
jgi:hypothetical protein